MPTWGFPLQSNHWNQGSQMLFYVHCNMSYLLPGAPKLEQQTQFTWDAQLKCAMHNKVGRWRACWHYRFSNIHVRLATYKGTTINIAKEQNYVKATIKHVYGRLIKKYRIPETLNLLTCDFCIFSLLVAMSVCVGPLLETRLPVDSRLLVKERSANIA